MPTLQLNTETNDLIIENNDFVFIDNSDFVKQMLKVNLQTFLGEVFTNLSIGTPYFQTIFTKAVNLRQVEAVIKDVILDTVGVLNLSFFELDYDNEIRKLIVNFAVETMEGIIELPEVILG